MRRNYLFLVLAILVLSAFYPAVLAGISKIDDEQLFRNLSHAATLNLHALFFPSSSGGSYYRPLLMCSYYFDKIVLGLYPGLMHLENVLLQLLNAILVFLIAESILPAAKRRKSISPFVAALLFGLHPITTESVNWISGRSDVLAGTFLLFSTLFLMRYRERKGGLRLALAVFFFLFAVLTKETSLAFCPAFFFLLRSDAHEQDQSERNPVFDQRSSRYRSFAVILGALSVVLVFALFRSIAFTSNSSRIGITLMSATSDWVHTMLILLQAFGFYMKKLIIPYPLNLAIMEVDPLYQLLAVPLVIAAILIALRRSILSAYFLTGLLLIMPAFILVFSQIAWTPYAERYIYLASPFMIIAAVMYIEKRLDARFKPALKFAVPVLLTLMFLMTFQRSYVWHDDYLLIKDTVSKSPRSRPMHSLYASVLAVRGEYDKALEQIRIGESLPHLGKVDDQVDMVTAFIAAKQGRIDDAICMYKQIYRQNNGDRITVLRNLVILFNMKKDQTRQAGERRALTRRIEEYTRKIFDLTHDPLILYNMGSVAMAERRYGSSLRYFRIARNSMVAQDPYRFFAEERIKHILELTRIEHAQNL